jgi:hypothetical protein
MTEAMSEFFEEGVERGLSRAFSYGFEFGEEPDASLDRLRYVIETHPDYLSGRIITLFVENAIVAIVAREVYKENPPSEDDLRAFLDHFARFFNSVPWPLRGHPEAMKMDPSPS